MTNLAETTRLQIINDYHGLAELREQLEIAKRTGHSDASDLAARIEVASSVLEVYEGMPISQEITGSGGPFGEVGVRSTITGAKAPGEYTPLISQGRFAKIAPTIDYKHPNIVDLTLCWSCTDMEAMNPDRETVTAIYTAGLSTDRFRGMTFNERVATCIDLDDALAAAKAWIAQAIIPQVDSIPRYPNAHHYKLRGNVRTLADHHLA